MENLKERWADEYATYMRLRNDDAAVTEEQAVRSLEEFKASLETMTEEEIESYHREVDDLVQASIDQEWPADWPEWPEGYYGMLILFPCFPTLPDYPKKAIAEFVQSLGCEIWAERFTETDGQFYVALPERPEGFQRPVGKRAKMDKADQIADWLQKKIHKALDLDPHVFMFGEDGELFSDYTLVKS